MMICVQCGGDATPNYQASRKYLANRKFCSNKCAFSYNQSDAVISSRFWEKVNCRSEADCWEWNGFRTKSGYGQFGYKRKIVRAHRLALIFSGIDVPSDAVVLHQCDNPACCSPAHLKVGTQQQNLADMRKKGRHARGEKQGNSKLTKREVLEIRASSSPLLALAERYGISQSTACQIRRGRRWKHV